MQDFIQTSIRYYGRVSVASAVHTVSGSQSQVATSRCETRPESKVVNKRYVASAATCATPKKLLSIHEMNRLAWTDASVRQGALFREIRAVHDLATVRVYQAYNAEIADAAAAANSFKAPLAAGKWSSTRMTWIKPSAVWMAYRCGWTVMKDKNQDRVLALDISRTGFEDLLRSAQLSHGGADDKRETGSLKEQPVVVQWDPERLMHPNAAERRHALTSDIQNMRSIQIGLRGSSVERLLDPQFVLRITDVTADFAQAHRHLSASPPDVSGACAALWPDRQEEIMLVPEDLRRVLKMDPEDR